MEIIGSVLHSVVYKGMVDQKTGEVFDLTQVWVDVEGSAPFKISQKGTFVYKRDDSIAVLLTLNGNKATYRVKP